MESSTEQVTIEEFQKVDLKVKGKKAVHNGKILKTQTEDIAVDAKDGEKIR